MRPIGVANCQRKRPLTNVQGPRENSRIVSVGPYRIARGLLRRLRVRASRWYEWQVRDSLVSLGRRPTSGGGPDSGPTRPPGGLVEPEGKGPGGRDVEAIEAGLYLIHLPVVVELITSHAAQDRGRTVCPDISGIKSCPVLPGILDLDGPTEVAFKRGGLDESGM